MVSDNDTVFHLGDFCLCGRDWDKYENIINSLNGNKILIKGNHDNKNMPEHLKKYWKYIFKEKEIKITKDKDEILTIFLKHHYQFSGKYAKKFLVLHGHSHAKTPLCHNRINQPRIDMGVDAWEYKPVNIKQLMKFIKENKIYEIHT